MHVGVCLRSLRSPISWSPDPSRIITPLHDVAATTIALPPSISLASTFGRGALLWIRSLFLFMHFPPLEMPLTPVLIFKSHPPAFPTLGNACSKCTSVTSLLWPNNLPACRLFCCIAFLACGGQVRRGSVGNVTNVQRRRRMLNTNEWC